MSLSHLTVLEEFKSRSYRLVVGMQTLKHTVECQTMWSSQAVIDCKVEKCLIRLQTEVNNIIRLHLD